MYIAADKSRVLEMLTVRTAHVAVGVVSCVLASGITYGFAASKPELIDEKVYQYLCGDAPPDPVLSGACYVQDLR